jgi:hypothetical protein
VCVCAMGLERALAILVNVVLRMGGQQRWERVAECDVAGTDGVQRRGEQGEQKACPCRAGQYSIADRQAAT